MRKCGECGSVSACALRTPRSALPSHAPLSPPHMPSTSSTTLLFASPPHMPCTRYSGWGPAQRACLQKTTTRMTMRSGQEGAGDLARALHLVGAVVDRRRHWPRLDRRLRAPPRPVRARASANNRLAHAHAADPAEHETMRDRSIAGSR
eukprot:3288868-Rhodomonas_salina.2